MLLSSTSPFTPVHGKYFKGSRSKFTLGLAHWRHTNCAVGEALESLGTDELEMAESHSPLLPTLLSITL